MNTTNLATFVAVMQTGSISSAAEKLYITQPAVSKRIKNLEDEFGTALFDTVGRSIIPTAAAYDLLPFVRRWLDDYEACKASLQHAKEVASGRLVIGTSHHIGLHHLAHVLKRFIQTYPAVQLEVRFVDSEEAHKAVLEGEISLAFLTLPPTFDRRLNYHTLWSDPLYFVTGTLSPLAQKSKVSLLQLAHYPAILPAANTFTSQITLAEFAKHNLRPYATMSTNPLESIRMLVSVGLGWSVLPETLINQDLIKIDMAENIELQRHLGLVTNPNLTRSASMQALLSMLSIND
ncbi:LysR family transcriptional regulator [Moraxella catarrhalis]|jgi:transcriptional regulator, LysR family|uniref:Bacterial regulatory helix-turn-helix, lysR family protein n=2 Tax=Bacteria TaxID=2 RepID=A0A3A9P4P0_MORCA|nr:MULTISPECIES: LysR family transcriptional regulator [Moraxella]AIK01588.1 bacterial regulatory helix-turn-helix, lysR family protein [Moraxella catarrhalis]AIT43434.1 CysJI operon transcriptional activator [Moraxella catarrhalis]ARB67808.1 LysR family transcriptional regulator [Moraxella catarrhalis]ARE65832.1 LysR family transcriptional regulator [Moraxella catarrhalis]AVL49680.1 LysR family transcriptional regulator [Moraxella catarrhalis]